MREFDTREEALEAIKNGKIYPKVENGEIGSYLVGIWNDSKKIFVRNKDDETIMVSINKAIISLRHKKTDHPVEFRYYHHQKRPYWGDSRRDKIKIKYDDENEKFVVVVSSGGSIPPREVENSLARMLFKGDKSLAKAMMRQVQSLID